MQGQAAASAGKANHKGNQKTDGGKTLLASVFLSSPGVIATGAAAFQSMAGTQIADWLRRTAECGALVVSYLVYRNIERHSGMADAEKRGLENRANRAVGSALALAGVMMFTLALLRVRDFTVSGNVLIGLVIAIMGVTTNGFFWFRYGLLSAKTDSAVLAAQQRLYRAKTLVDCVVTAALLTLRLAPASPSAHWVDVAGTAAVSVYLCFQGGKVLWGTKAG